MRRNRRKSKKNISVYAIIGICFLFLFTMGIIYAQVSQTLFFTGTVRVKETIEDIAITLNFDNKIDEGTTRIRYNYTYTITNNTEQNITNWKVLVSNMPASSTEIAEWNHVILQNDVANGRVIFGPKEWNVTITPRK